MSKSDSLKEVVQAYLERRAKSDGLFADKYANPKKNIDECCKFILGEARKRGNAVCISDDEVFGMAVHYYDEDDIKINVELASSRPTVATKVELTEEDKEVARQVAIRRAVEEQYKSLKKKPGKKKVEDDVQQMSLF